MIDFLFSQQDYILFFYGASLIILASACFVMKRREEDFLPWLFLALYGFFHGIREWLEILEPFFVRSELFNIFSLFLRLVSYLSLFEFGRSGLSRFTGKAPGRWIIIPLLAITALGGFAGGAWFINTAQYIILLPGGLLAAILLVLVSQRLKDLPRFLLMTCGLMMALYAILSVVLTEFTWGLPQGLLRGALCFGMAFVISLYSQLSAGMDTALHYFSRQSKYVFWICALAMVLIIAGGWMTTQYLGDKARKDIVSLAHSHIETLNSQVHALVATINEDVLTIAEDTDLIQSIATGKRDLKRATALLDYYHSTRKEEIVYILDAKGKVLTSSNRRSHNSIVGQDFSHHDYVKQSLRGVTGNYPAFGLATEERGFTASYPVYRERKIVGIAAIKVSMDSLAMDFERIPGFAFLVSPEGIIFLASHSELTVASLWPLNNEVIEKLATSRQFGAGPFNALLPNKPRDGQDIQFEGKKYVFTRNIISDLELRGWSIVLLNPTEQINIYRLLGIIVTLLLCVLTVSFFVGMEKSLESTADFAVSESRFRTVFEGAPGAIFIFDKANRRILSVNPFMIDWLGYTENKLLSMSLDEIRVEEGASDGECRYRKQDGAVTHVEEVRKPIFFHRSKAILTIAHDISDRKKTEELLVGLSLSDGLTGIANRRHFDEFLEQEWRRAVREGTPLSLIMSDIDFFKAYNDTYGHLAGDDCLRQVAGVMREMQRRPADMAARYGGEEFAMVMARTDLEGAVLLAESLRSLVEALGIPNAGSPSAVQLVTLSLGVATLVPSRDKSSSELVAAADRALYQAKSDGRNCVRAQLISS